MSYKILIVDDDKKTVELVKLYLKNEGYQVIHAYDGQNALYKARQEKPDLIILDLMLPKIDGIDICRILRSESQIPIIMLTARSTEADKLKGLNLGADDYVTKPFSPREVVARVRAVLRRIRSQSQKSPSILRFENLTIDFVRHEARLNEKPIHLTPKEFKLLEIMSGQAERAFSRLELVSYAFGKNYEGLDRTIDVHIMNLRKKIEANPEKPRMIKTVYGKGYKFIGKSVASSDET